MKTSMIFLFASLLTSASAFAGNGGGGGVVGAKLASVQMAMKVKLNLGGGEAADQKCIRQEDTVGFTLPADNQILFTLNDGSTALLTYQEGCADVYQMGNLGADADPVCPGNHILIYDASMNLIGACLIESIE